MMSDTGKETNNPLSIPENQMQRWNDGTWYVEIQWDHIREQHKETNGWRCWTVGCKDREKFLGLLLASTLMEALGGSLGNMISW